MKILYAKYESYRRPEYQIETKIIKDGEKKYIVKKGITEQAQVIIEKIKKQDVVPVKCALGGIVIECPKGKRLDIVLEEYLLTNEFIDKVDNYISLIINSIPHRFQNVCFEDFIFQNGEAVCINPEWISEDEVSKEYMEYCLAYNLYNKFSDEIQMSLRDYLYSLGMDDDDINSCEEKRFAFDMKVYGKNYVYRYDANYVKEVTSLNQMNEQVKRIDDLQFDNSRLKARNQELEKYAQHIHRIKSNPSYALKFIGKKIVGKKDM